MVLIINKSLLVFELVKKCVDLLFQFLYFPLQFTLMNKCCSLHFDALFFNRSRHQHRVGHPPRFLIGSCFFHVEINKCSVDHDLLKLIWQDSAQSLALWNLLFQILFVVFHFWVHHLELAFEIRFNFLVLGSVCLFVVLFVKFADGFWLFHQLNLLINFTDFQLNFFNLTFCLIQLFSSWSDLI